MKRGTITRHPKGTKAGTSFTPAFTQDGDEEESPPEECVYATKINTVIMGAIRGGISRWRDCENKPKRARDWYIVRDAQMSRGLSFEVGAACKSITPGEPPEIVDECACRDGCCDNIIKIQVRNGPDIAMLDPCNPDAQQQLEFEQFIGRVREAIGTEEGINLSFLISVENVRRDCCRVDPNSDIPPAEQLKECRRNILAGWKVEKTALGSWQETMFGGDGLNQMDVEIGSFQFPAGEPWSLPDDSVCFREGWRPFTGSIWYPFSMDEYTSEECQKPKETKEEILSLLNTFSTISGEKLCVLTTAGLPDLISGGGDALQEIISYLTGMFLAGGNDGGTPIRYPSCPLTPRMVIKFFNSVLQSLSPGDPLCD